MLKFFATDEIISTGEWIFAPNRSHSLTKVAPSELENHYAILEPGVHCSRIGHCVSLTKALPMDTNAGHAYQ